MDIPDILKIIIFEHFLKIAKKGPPKDTVPDLHYKEAPAAMWTRKNMFF